MRIGTLAAIGVCLWAAVGASLATQVMAQSRAVMSQRDIAFAPGELRIRAGEEVVFRNEDPFGHNVFSPDQGGVFDIGLQQPETETPVRFSQPGEYNIRCRIHPKMRALVVVTP